MSYIALFYSVNPIIKQEYKKETLDRVLPGGRVIFGVKTPEDNAKKVAAKKAEKLAAKKKKEGEAAAKKRRRAPERETILEQE